MKRLGLALLLALFLLSACAQNPIVSVNVQNEVRDGKAVVVVSREMGFGNDDLTAYLFMERSDGGWRLIEPLTGENTSKKQLLSGDIDLTKYKIVCDTSNKQPEEVLAFGDGHPQAVLAWTGRNALGKIDLNCK